MKSILLALGLVAVFALTAAQCADPSDSSTEMMGSEADMMASEATSTPVEIDPAVADTAFFAGGCFWCEETAFEDVPGVAAVISGYTGGHVDHPTYNQVSAGGTGHAEAVEVIYDASQIDYETLLQIFWHNVDPLSAGGQFCDRGNQYRSAIFYRNAEQQRLAEASKAEIEGSGRFDEPIVTEIVAASTFYPAEEYHQDFYLKNPDRYHSYRRGCGRDARLDALWGDLARKPGPLG